MLLDAMSGEMQNLVSGTNGISLEVISGKDYQSWLATQDEICQNWIDSTKFNGIGLVLIPSSIGGIAKALFVYEKNSAYFSAPLFTLLPAEKFKLNCEKNIRFDICLGFLLQAYKFDRYRRVKAASPVLVVEDDSLVRHTLAIARSIYLVRDLINTPANDLGPKELSEVIIQTAIKFSCSTRELVGEQLVAEGYNAIYAVGAGSSRPPRLIEFRWGDPDKPSITIIGKGVCFDSGGLNLKSDQALPFMKKDMAGAAHALGLANLMMEFNIPVALRVLIPIVENSISGTAFRPGDVIVTRSGLSVEVDNTDAEGRLILCEALDEACRTRPDLVIDFATLTGACRTALGPDVPGFFCRDDELSKALHEASLSMNDMVWRLPFVDSYKSIINSDIADLGNYGTTQLGGAITAALFLERFIGVGIPWIHLDIMGWNLAAKNGQPRGGDAMGMMAVFEFIKRKYG